MHSLEILQQLKAGRISLADAKKALGAAAPAKEGAGTIPNGEVPPAREAAIPPAREAIAIVGMSGRYPGATDLKSYWDNLVKGRDAIREIPASRWDVSRYYDPAPLKKGKVYCKWMGMLDDIQEFDPLFFALSPKEAEWMDPQHRIFLQEAYKAFEDAGYHPKELNSRKCGVYLGIMSSEYAFLQYQYQPGISGATGNSFSIAAARIAYFLNLKGPAIAIDTACSSSLVATHLACQALLNKEIDMALTGGVSLYLTPESYISMCSAGMLSKEGKCKTFDDSADGFVPGEGAGALVLKRLDDARAGHDHIYGVILGSGINQDGRTNGITAPSAISQMALEREVYDRYHIDPESIQYVEMHGTGTKLGDPIELEALSTVYSERTRRKNFCAIGSVKSNIGHTSAAAGVAAIHKVLLSMQYGMLTPTLHVKQPNRHFNFSDSPFYIAENLAPWPATAGQARRAGISSFGFSGTNAHLVVEQYPQPHRNSSPGDPQASGGIFVLSAQSLQQLKQYALLVKEALSQNTDLLLTDVLYTLQTGRKEMDYRLAFPTDNSSHLSATLALFIADEPSDHYFTGRIPSKTGSGTGIYQEEYIEQQIRQSREKGDRAAIAKLWVSGTDIDWNKWYGSQTPYRVSLPTYPFAKEKYWIPEEPQPPASIRATEEPTHTMEEPIQAIEAPISRFLHKTWQPDKGAPSHRKMQEMIILSTEEVGDLAAALSRQLKGSRIVDIRSMDANSCPAGRTDVVIDITCCAETPAPCLDAIPWLQQFIGQDPRRETLLLGVTRGLEAFHNEDIHLSGAATASLYRMLGVEHRSLRSKHLDLEPGVPIMTLSQQIADEIKQETQYPEICIRGGLRYHAVLSPLAIPQTGEGHQRSPIDSRHVVWITGGTRGIGYQCALHLVRQYGVRKLVISGVEKIPSREQWDRLVRENAPVAGKIKGIRELELLGAEVLTLSVDLTDREAVRHSLEEVKKVMGPIGAIIHGAGLVDLTDPAFIRKTPAGIRRILHPKVEGSRVLYELLGQEPLAFFILFSSVAAAIPSLGAGQADYVMANSFMDYFATSCKSPFPVVSIQWPNWKETGLGEVKSKAYTQTGLLSHTNAQGLELLDRILTAISANAMPAPVILPAIVDETSWAPEQLMKSKTAEPARDGSEGIQVVTEKWLTRLLSEELKLDPSRIDPDKEFQWYGVDSILLAQIISKMDRTLNDLPIDPSSFMEYPSIRSLATYLTATFPEALRRLETPAPPSPQTLSSQALFPQTLCPQKEEERKKIAVVGIACHFPDAAGIREYWTNLVSGRDSIREVPLSRWDWKKFYHPQAEGKSGSKWGGFLPAIETFDAEFFHIPTDLAPYIDPLQRQLLEVSAEALCDAGYSKQDLWGKRVGVFAGARTGNFGYKFPGKVKDRIVGIGQNFITAHLAHIYNFKGPNIVIDTACSSSLTALHLAVGSIRSGESEIALAGGVDILLDEGVFLGLSDAKILSPDGRCKTFDARADGIGLGEGCGIVVLKSLEKAIEDNDKIYGVIDGSAINNDGNTMGVTTPNPSAQYDLMHAAILDAGIDPASISYVETHGTGTLIGDPIELKALNRIFAGQTGKKQFCGVGSVKSNFGHLLSASGAASLIKVLLSLIHRTLPPTLHCHQPNPRFNFQDSPLFPVQRLQQWGGPDALLRAGISSFGLGGNNANVLVSNQGIPDSHLATVIPRLALPVFQRKRHWPGDTQLAEEVDFKKFFEVKEA